MSSPACAARILIVDDLEVNTRLLCDLLAAQGHDCQCANSGLQGLQLAQANPPDLILLDVLMPDLDGFDVCRRLRADERFAAVPIVMVTSLEAREDRVLGLQAGADDFLTKPVVRPELYARVRSLLRVKTLYDQVARQRSELLDWSATLERRVAEKVAEVERLSRLKRFFSPRLAARLVEAGGGMDPMQTHRTEVTVLFADLRGFTAFTERVPAEVVMATLAEFHTRMGRLIFDREGTLERFTGDGMMVFFNDPDPVALHSHRAVSLGLAMQREVGELAASWQVIQGPLGLGVGVSRGIATVGAIGFEGRLDYAAIGSVTNLAARLCSEAEAGEVLVCDAVWRVIERDARGEFAGAHALKGFSKPAAAWHVSALS